MNRDPASSPSDRGVHQRFAHRAGRGPYTAFGLSMRPYPLVLFVGGVLFGQCLHLHQHFVEGLDGPATIAEVLAASVEDRVAVTVEYPGQSLAQVYRSLRWVTALIGSSDVIDGSLTKNVRVDPSAVTASGASVS